MRIGGAQRREKFRRWGEKKIKAMARSAYRPPSFSNGNAALSKAETNYVQASELAHDSGSGGIEQAIADGLGELRKVIDELKSDETQEKWMEGFKQSQRVQANCSRLACRLKRWD